MTALDSSDFYIIDTDEEAELDLSTDQEIPQQEGKYFSFSRWFRIKDKKQCCSEYGCFNLRTYSSGLCRKCGGGRGTCNFPGCKTRPIFGLPGGKKTFCFNHKKPSMINLIDKLCNHSGCNSHAKFAFPGAKIPLYCRKHRDKTMIDIKSKLCIIEGCNTYPGFGLRESKTSTHCAKHKEPFMIKKTKTCQFEGCNIQPKYGNEGTKNAIFCKKHKESKMINVRIKLCEIENCKLSASYGYAKSKPTYCKLHSDPSMINFKTKLCKFPECTISATFGFEGSYRPMRCSKHKDDSMVYVKNKRCLISGCKKRARYGDEKSRKVLLCHDHKESWMIEIDRKYCDVDGCKTCASFGISGSKYPNRCLKHKECNMILLTKSRSSSCQFPNCKVSASYGIKGTSHALFCSKHRETSMVNLKVKLCKVPNCCKMASYGFPGNIQMRCAGHKSIGMIMNSRRRCAVSSCHEIAIYGLTNALHCEIHKKTNEINLIERECKSCNLSNILGLDDLCGYCNPENIKTTRLAKQNEVEKFLLCQGYQPVVDKTIDFGECGKERPDFLFWADDHAVIIEVDEDQHMTRDCACEQTRMINIWQSLQIPVTFIRYNPDKFRYHEGEKRQDHISRQLRLNKLKSWLDFSLRTSPRSYDCYVNVLYLFFDGYTETQKYIVIQ